MTGPALVRQRDGTLETFDADRICAALFAAGVKLGRPDAFLARELTDGVVHFLAEDASETASVEDVREIVIKVVRELGQPHLARAYETHTALRADRPAPRPSDSVFAPEVQSARDERLLVLESSRAPSRLAARVLPWPRMAAALPPLLAEMSGSVSETLVLDGPEHWLAQVGLTSEEYAAILARAVSASELEWVVNLNIPTPPREIEPLATGPLFADRGPLPGRREDLPAGLFALLSRLTLANLRLVWHVGPDGTGPPGATEFVFPRKRRSPRLAEGVDRDGPILLLRVGVCLPRLLGPLGREPDEEAFLAKVGSLARLALSAGVQKRAYLRRNQGDLSAGFLLDRARVQVYPLGLDVVVMRLTGRGILSGGTALDLGRKILHRLRDVLRTDGRRVQLATCLDDPPPGARFGEQTPPLGVRDFCTDATRCLRAVSALHEVTERGVLQIPAGHLADTLARIAEASEIDRVRVTPEESRT